MYMYFVSILVFSWISVGTNELARVSINIKGKKYQRIVFFSLVFPCLTKNTCFDTLIDFARFVFNLKRTYP